MSLGCSSRTRAKLGEEVRDASPVGSNDTVIVLLKPLEHTAVDCPGRSAYQTGTSDGVGCFSPFQHKRLMMWVWLNFSHAELSPIGTGGD